MSQRQITADVTARRMTDDEFGALPLSKCLEIALHDLEMVEKMEGVKVDMAVYHRHRDFPVVRSDAASKDYAPQFERDPAMRCIMCMAGAVMHCTLGVNYDDAPALFKHNEAAQGRLQDISDIAVLGRHKGKSLSKHWSYLLNPDQFKASIRAYIETLQAEGQ